MIKIFKIFENMPGGTINMDYIIGFPSGQIIDVKYTDINNLKQHGYVDYNRKLMSYVFKDDNYDIILRFLKRKSDDWIDSSYLSDDKMDEIEDFFDKQQNVRNYILVQGGKIDVSGSIYISGQDYHKLPMRFKRVSGDFIFKSCKLITLDGGPEEVGGDFIVSSNNLSDLYCGPTYVGKSYDCSSNLLMSLLGSPSIIRNDFDCSDNFLTNFKDGPKVVKGTFSCLDNPLKSMEGVPHCNNIVGGMEGGLRNIKFKN